MRPNPASCGVRPCPGEHPRLLRIAVPSHSCPAHGAPLSGRHRTSRSVCIPASGQMSQLCSSPEDSSVHVSSSCSSPHRYSRPAPTSLLRVLLCGWAPVHTHRPGTLHRASLTLCRVRGSPVLRSVHGPCPAPYQQVPSVVTVSGYGNFVKSSCIILLTDSSSRLWVTPCP